jgi:hypothetical protein
VLLSANTSQARGCKYEQFDRKSRQSHNPCHQQHERLSALSSSAAAGSTTQKCKRKASPTLAAAYHLRHCTPTQPPAYCTVQHRTYCTVRYCTALLYESTVNCTPPHCNGVMRTPIDSPPCLSAPQRRSHAALPLSVPLRPGVRGATSGEQVTMLHRPFQQQEELQQQHQRAGAAAPCTADDAPSSVPSGRSGCSTSTAGTRRKAWRRQLLRTGRTAFVLAHVQCQQHSLLQLSLPAFRWSQLSGGCHGRRQHGCWRGLHWLLQQR